MKQSARLRVSGILLALFSIGFSCLLLGTAQSARPCCPDGSCQAMLASRCCDTSSSLPSVAPGGPPALLADRIDYVVSRWIVAPRIESIGRESAAALGIRTTVLRL